MKNIHQQEILPMRNLLLMSIQMRLKYMSILCHWIQMRPKFMIQQNYAGTDSDSTEIYEINEQIIGTITHSTAKLPFKCPSKLCNIRCDHTKENK